MATIVMPPGGEPLAVDEKVAALQGWRLAEEAASRSNRNLLQYGAGIAAVLGIAAGSGGILAVADSLRKAQDASAQLPGSLAAMFVVVDVVAALLTLILFGLLIDAFMQRRDAEALADRYMKKLIEFEYAHFLSETK